jgi:hypothetical protein
MKHAFLAIIFLASCDKCARFSKTKLLSGGHHWCSHIGTPFSGTADASTPTGILVWYFLVIDTGLDARFKFMIPSPYKNRLRRATDAT